MGGGVRARAPSLLRPFPSANAHLEATMFVLLMALTAEERDLKEVVN